MSSESQEEEEQPEVTPLDIGYEVLPEGVSAVDFVEYEFVHQVKPTKYRKDEIPHHDLFGDKAVIHRELLEDEPIEHSELWLNIVSKLDPELLPNKNKRTNFEEEYLPCHLVDEPMRQRLLPSLLPRKFIKEDEEGENGKSSSEMEEDSDKKMPMFDFEALEKLKETVNWLKFCDDENTDDTDSD